MSDAERWDVVIVGSGAGGSSLAWRLAPTGKRVLVIERGELLPKEPENWDPHEVATRGRYRAKDAWRDRDDVPFEPFTHHWVGGNTKMYGAALLRLREADFGVLHHHGGVSPAWPIAYAELEPYYGMAERLFSVHGLRGTDPCEPRASEGFPHAPIPHEPSIEALRERLVGAGLRPFPLPLGLRLPTGEATSPVNLSLFDGYPDPSGTKADAQVCALEPATRLGEVTVRTGARAVRFLTSPSGREITGLVVRRGDHEETIRADLFVTACGAIESAALWLRSASDAHPRGLGNASGLVGRGYMTHHNGAVVWVSRRFRNTARFQKTLGITDFYLRGPGSDRPLGTIQLMGRSHREEMRGLMEGRIEDRDVDDVLAHATELWLTAEDLPDDDNRITVDRRGIKLAYRRTNFEAYTRLRAALVATLEKLDPGGVALGYELGVGGVSHQNGSLRFGSDPARSVLDVDCRAHGIDNLYACDASFFPSSGAVNPSLTIIANALRVGDHLARRLA